MRHSAYTLRQRFSNTQQSRFLTAGHRRLEKLVLPSIIDRQFFHPWSCETCRVVQQQFWMKQCDIFRGQNILWPLLHIFRGSGRPNPPGSTLLTWNETMGSLYGPKRISSYVTLFHNPAKIDGFLGVMQICMCEGVCFGVFLLVVLMLL